MKLFIFLILVFGSVAGAKEITPTLKNSFGDVYFVSFEVAQDYCQKHSMRVPTAREFAGLAQSMGAKGIRETQYPGISVKETAVQQEIMGANYRDKFFPIYKKNENGTVSVDFYFNNVGYKFNSPEAMQNIEVWTSTLEPSPIVSSFPPQLMVWLTGSGSLTTRMSSVHAIRCVRD